ncbi:hypothetical protein ACWGIN_27755 [Streptomyces sp. NPDC054861]
MTDGQARHGVHRALRRFTQEQPLDDDGMMREPRVIKNDASVVIKVERPDLDEPESSRAGEVDIVIEKNGSGP